MDKKSNPTNAYQVKPQAPNFNVAQSSSKLYIASSALGFDLFVHRPKARSPKARLKFGDAGATTIQQGFDVIVHLRKDWTMALKPFRTLCYFLQNCLSQQGSFKVPSHSCPENLCRPPHCQYARRRLWCPAPASKHHCCVVSIHSKKVETMGSPLYPLYSLYPLGVKKYVNF